MDESTPRSELLSALTTEHFVLQNAVSSTISEAAARSTLYVMALSSSLVAMGFLSTSRELFAPFVATVLPAIFLLGLFTVVRLVETSLESMHCLAGIARIRGVYRSLGPDAARHFSAARGRWPEADPPATRFGSVLAFFGTTASMIAVINNVVAGAGIALLVHELAPSASRSLYAAAGVIAAAVLTGAFYAYQRWRFADFDASEPHDD